MRVLIDTHAFLWFVKASPEISPAALTIMRDPAVDLLISVASLWELSIKTATGKLVIDGGFERVLPDLNKNFIEILPIDFSHTLKQNQLPFHHRDPFDRMIASQALVEEIYLISADDAFDRYFDGTEVSRIW